VDDTNPAVKYAKSKYICTVCWQVSSEPPCENCKSSNGYYAPIEKTRAVKKKSKKTKKTAHTSVVDLIDQNTFEQYLEQKTRLGIPVEIRYQSARKNSAKKWRQLYLSGYDGTYLLAASYKGIPYRYRRDRIVEFR